MTDKIREFIENNDIDGMPIGTLEVGINRLFVELLGEVEKKTWITVPQGYREIDVRVVDLADIHQAFTDFGVEFPTSPQGEQP